MSPRPGRLCPACELMIALPGDRYCAGCSTAYDRQGWVAGRELSASLGWQS